MDVPKPKQISTPGWVVTFADMMALLLCLFVLLLSFAELEAEAFKKIASSMRAAFSVDLTGSVSAGLGGQATQQMQAVQGTIPPPQVKIEKVEVEVQVEVAPQKKENPTLNLMTTAMKEEIDNRKMSISEKDGAVIVRFPDKAIFSSGSADLAPDILATLDKLAAALAETGGELVVSGHTDNVPIRTDRFPSNWELSSGRAASVVHYLLKKKGIDPKMISASGFADSRPLKPHDSAENRATNRRVEIVIRGGTAPKSEEPPKADASSLIELK